MAIAANMPIVAATIINAIRENPVDS